MARALFFVWIVAATCGTHVAVFGNTAPAADFGTVTQLSHPEQLAFADLDGDGHFDLVTKSTFGGTAMALNAGDGTFADFQWSWGDGLNFAITDANGDGRADIVTTETAQDTVNLQLGTPAGAPPTVKRVDPLPEAGESRIAVGDVNGDGAPDAVVCAEDYIFVVALDGRAAPTLASQNVQLTAMPVCAVADLSGDGTADYIVAGKGRLDIWSTDASGHLPSLSTLYPNDDDRYPSSLSAIDLNNDGRPDLIASSDLSGGFLVWLNAGDGSFGVPSSVAPGLKPSTPALADIDGDGNPDILAIADMKPIALLGDGHGSFTQTELDLDLPDSAFTIAAADVDGDGRVDLAITGPDRVWVLRNQTSH